MCAGCASSYPHFATYLKDCPEDKIRIIAVHDYGEPRVFDLEACGTRFEVEERVRLTEAKGLRPEEMHEFRRKLSGSAPSRIVQAVKGRMACREFEILGSETSQGPEYWFLSCGVLYFAAMELGSPSCPHRPYSPSCYER